MKTLRNYTKKLIGKNHNENIYLDAPSWNCGWYWGFGYLGNRNCHYHFDGLNKNKDLHGAIIEHFGSSLQIRTSDVWVFAELIKTFYNLKNTAELLGSGSSHLTSNPCKDLIINKDEVKRINEIVLPSVFDEIYKILERNENNNKLFKKLVSINLKGDTKKVIDFMKKNSIKTDDLETIEGITKNDFSIIHSFYWEDYHSNKK